MCREFKRSRDNFSKLSDYCIFFLRIYERGLLMWWWNERINAVVDLLPGIQKFNSFNPKESTSTWTEKP